MVKLLKIPGRILGVLLEWTLILLIIVSFSIRMSAVQTWLAGLATDYLSKELKTEMRIAKVDFYFFDRVALDGIFVRDQKGDTLASLGSVKVVLGSLNLDANKVVLSNISLEHGKVGINRDSLTGNYNYWFITDYFASKEPSSGKKPMLVTVEGLNIEHVDIAYDDYRKGYSDFGMDYDHLSFDDVVLNTSNFVVDGPKYTFNLDQLSTREKAGFDLRELNAKCKISDKGIFLSDLIIKTPRSRIYASKLKLWMHGLRSIYTFEDSVTFDAKIDSSVVNLADVAQFATALEGMNQEVHLKTEIYRKVKDLKIANMDLRTGRRTILRGTLLLPDFRSMEGSFLKENLDYAYVDLKDLQEIRLPVDVEERFIALDSTINRLGYFEAKRMNVIGYASQFVMSTRQLSTELGTVHLDNGLLFTELKEGGYSFEQSANSDYDVYIDSFHVGKFIGEEMLGKVKGSLFVNGVVGQEDVIRLTKISGVINSFGFNDYTYTNITVPEGSFIDNVFKADVEIKDPAVELSYHGAITIGNGQHFDMTVDVPHADLKKLNFTKKEATISAALHVDAGGHGLSDYSGTVDLDHLEYKEEGHQFNIPKLNLSLTRGASDRVVINSNIADIEAVGKVDPNTVATSINNLLAGPLSSYFAAEKVTSKKPDNNFFDVKVTVNNATDFLAIFAPNLMISSGTVVTASYDARSKKSDISISNAAEISYDGIVVRNLKVDEHLENNTISAKIDAGTFALNDSLRISALDVDINGTNNSFNTVAQWNQHLQDSARFAFTTVLGDSNEVRMRLKPSYFALKHQLWEIQNSSTLVYKEKRVEVNHLVLEREEQFVTVDGVLSSDPKDKILVHLNGLHLDEVTAFINSEVPIGGTVTGRVEIGTPFTTIRLNGNINAKDLTVSGEEVGDVDLGADWHPEQQRVEVTGKLRYRSAETFDFAGNYFPYKEKNNLKIDLNFDGMDMQFANVFMDPSVISDIKGKLHGRIEVDGEIDAPVMKGELDLRSGSAKVGLLGTSFRVNGPIKFNNSQVDFKEMTFRDEEGTTGSISGQVRHTNFMGWTCKLDLNMETDPSRRDLFGKPRRLTKFLVLNTPYKEGEIYYGKAYVTGTASIEVREEVTKIRANVETKEGTIIDLPMYGNSEIAESSAIRFTTDGEKEEKAPEVDLTGVELDLDFRVTPDAEVTLTFNDKTGDQIKVRGSGDLNISLDNTGDPRMSGTYTVKRGVYNFVMGPVKQPFFIRDGGTITWSGSSPEYAMLNIETYNTVNASFSDIGTTLDGGASSEEVETILRLEGTLYNPQIKLDIEAPKASSSGRAILARIKSDPNELQKQFFSLLLFKKFAPLNDNNSGGFGGVADVISTRIDDFINQMTGATKVNVGLGKEVSVGFERRLGKNQNFIVKTTLGVATPTSGTTTSTASQGASSNFIGDISIEYLINKDGTFRASVFNESNDNSIIVDKSRGMFRQGVGIHYQKEFDSRKDFRLIKLKREEEKLMVPIDHDPATPPVEKKEDENNTPVPAPAELPTPDSGPVREEEPLQ